VPFKPERHHSRPSDATRQAPNADEIWVLSLQLQGRKEGRVTVHGRITDSRRATRELCNCRFSYDLRLHIDAHFVKHDASEMQPRKQWLDVLGQTAHVTPNLSVSKNLTA
jgi:hypothetical protein